jgi:RHS repeat-associated protein
MYDAKGEKTWEAHLDIYGKVRTFAGRSLSDCPFRYQGQYQDEETGLYYNRFRYYDPSIGSYISQYPIGLAGNNPTLYGYVNNPAIWIDILGLSGQLTIYSDSPEGDPIGHAFISITENGKTEYIGQWPDPGFNGKGDIAKITFSDMQGALDFDDRSHLNSPDLVQRTYDIDDAQMANLRRYMDDFNANNGNGKGYNLRNRQCASFAYGASQAAGIDEMKIPWYKKNLLFGVTPHNLAPKINSLNH